MAVYNDKTSERLAGIGNVQFSDWRKTNKYYGKKFSVLGDSISTFAGFNPPGYKIFYQGENCVKSGISDKNRTWWQRVINYLGGELLVNNSYAYSRVTQMPDTGNLFPSGCSKERTSSLHSGKVQPDVILVLMGSSDWLGEVPLTGSVENYFNEEIGKNVYGYVEDEFSFSYAYDVMLNNIKANYPRAEIWCCTLFTTYMTQNPEFDFFKKYKNNDIEKYNCVIRESARKNGCKLIDLSKFKIHIDTFDGVNLSVAGMKSLAVLAVREIADERGNKYLDCKNNAHEFSVVGKTQTENHLCCHKCGRFKTESRSGVFEAPVKVNHTERLFSNTLVLWSEKNSNAGYKKGKVTVGRTDDNDVVINSPKISRNHATFYYNDYTWYIKDVSTNGVWVNSKKIEKGELHKLSANDIIDFAHVEKYVFYKEEQSPVKRVKKTILNEKNVVGGMLDNSYRVLRLLGKGGTFKVYLVEDVSSGELFAAKMCFKKDKKYSSIIRDMVFKETSAVKELDHPMIPKIYEIIETDEFLCIIEEYITGETLEAIVNRESAQSPETAIGWGLQLCDVLSYLHTLNPPRIFRDLKPANIMLRDNGKIALIDFGIMRCYDPQKKSDTACFGTKGYAAPEQFGRRQSDARTDIYALGMTLHHLLTGVGPNSKKYEYRPIRQINPLLSVELEEIIDKCVAISPSARYGSCEDLAKELKNSI